MMHGPPVRRLSRRSMVGLMAAGVAAGCSGQALAQRSSLDDEVELCREEPSIQMLDAWRSGISPYESSLDAGPQPDWQYFEHPDMLGPSLVPPDWFAFPGWADSYSRSGAPRWEDERMSQPQLTSSRVVSPDGDAAFELVTGTVHGALLTLDEAMHLARQSVVVPDPDLRRVCYYEDPQDLSGPSWFSADRHERSLLITMGTIFHMPSDYAPMTGLGFNLFIGPRRQMEDLMYDVFLRILYQFLRKPEGGDDTPTPTPEPTP